MKVILVEYCSCIYESAFETISVHRTYESAARSMCKLKGVQYQRELGILELNNWEEFRDIGGYRRMAMIGEGGAFTAFRYRLIDVED